MTGLSPIGANLTNALTDAGDDFQAVSLLERDGEVKRIDEALLAARAGEGALVVIEGPGGIGKTELLMTARQRGVEIGMAVASARGSELERELAFGVVRQLLEPMVAGADRAARAELFAGAAALAEPLFALSATSGLSPGQPEDQTFAVLHGLYWLCSNVAQAGPLLLAVDDAHWADLSSLRFLAYLAQRREDLPLALVVAARPAETAVEEELLVRLATDPRSVAIAPAPLSREAVAALLRGELQREPEDVFVGACHHATGGTPFLLRELVRELRAQRLEPVAAAAGRIEGLGPRTVARSVLARIRRLGPAALDLAKAVAVLGADAEPRRAARLVGVEEAATGAWVDALVAAGVIRAGRPVEFVHPIVRSAVYAEAPGGERARLHGLAARLLAQEGVGEERIASHLLASDPCGDADAVELLLRTGRLALSRGAPGSAASYLERALVEPPAGELLVEVLCELGRAEIAQGRRAAFADHLGRGIRASTDPERRAEIALDLGRGLAQAGDSPGAVAVLEEALEGLVDRDSPLAMRLEGELFAAALVHYPSVNAIRVRLLARLAQFEAGELDEPTLLAPLAHTAVIVRPPAGRGADVAERLTQHEQWAPNAYVGGVIADALLFAGRFERDAQWLDGAISGSRALGWRLTLAGATWCRANALLHQGLLAGAEVDARFALDLAAEDSIVLVFASAILIEALLARGAADEAAAVLAGARRAEDHPPTYARSLLLAARGRLGLAQGDASGALADALASGEGLSRHANPATRPWRSDAACALRVLGRLDEAREHAQLELSLARDFEVPHAIGTALRAIAACADDEDEVALLREAVDVLEGSEARLELARALVDLGAALRRNKRRAESQEPLRRGLDLADRCGASPLAERARTELLATGARPRRRALSGVESLTASERRVAELAAGEMTNREIAQALFVTTRTVEGHLTHVFRKLDIESRTQLAERLAAEPSP